MVEQPEPQFDAPIPGASLTAEVGSVQHKNPPQHSSLEQALASYMETMQDESFVDNLVAGLEMGVPVTTIANMIQLKGVMDGLHSIDVSILIMPIIMEMIAYIAESRNVEYDMGIDDNREIPSEESILASINKLQSREPEAMQQEVPQEEMIEEEPSTGLMARSI